MEYVIKGNKIFIKSTLFMKFSKESFKLLPIILLIFIIITVLAFIYKFISYELLNVAVFFLIILLTTFIPLRSVALNVKVIRMDRPIGRIRTSADKNYIKYEIKLEGRPLTTLKIPKGRDIRSAIVTYGNETYDIKLKVSKDFDEIYVVKNSEEIIKLRREKGNHMWAVFISHLDIATALALSYVITKSYKIIPSAPSVYTQMFER